MVTPVATRTCCPLYRSSIESWSAFEDGFSRMTASGPGRITTVSAMAGEGQLVEEEIERRKRNEPPMTRSGGSSGFSSTSRSYTSSACTLWDPLQHRRRKGKQRPLTFADPVATAY
jgi:hypothetical protein